MKKGSINYDEEDHLTSNLNISYYTLGSLLLILYSDVIRWVSDNSFLCVSIYVF